VTSGLGAAITEVAAYDPEFAVYWRALVGELIGKVRLRLERVTFGYDGDLPALLGDIDLDVPAGTRVVRALPALAEGDRLGPRSVDAKGHETQPPARFTEASLVKALFPVDSVRRGFLKAVGANTARAAIASFSSERSITTSSPSPKPRISMVTSRSPLFSFIWLSTPSSRSALAVSRRARERRRAHRHDGPRNP